MKYMCKPKIYPLINNITIQLQREGWEEEENRFWNLGTDKRTHVKISTANFF